MTLRTVLGDSGGASGPEAGPVRQTPAGVVGFEDRSFIRCRVKALLPSRASWQTANALNNHPARGRRSCRLILRCMRLRSDSERS